MNFDVLAPVAKAASQLKEATAESQQPPPFSVSGPSAQSINRNAATVATPAEFYTRGGLMNSAQDLVNSLVKTKRTNALKKAYEDYLSAGEAGGKALYQDALNTYGEDVKGYVPPPQLFYDEQTGSFLPHQYAQAVYVGSQKYLADKRAMQQKEDERYRTIAANQAVAPLIESATNPQQANAGILRAGLNPKDYGDVINSIPKPESPIETQTKQANLERIRSETARSKQNYRREKEEDPFLEKAKADLREANKNHNALQTSLRAAKDKKNQALKSNPLADMSGLDEDIATLETDISHAKAMVASASAALTEIVKNQKTEARKAAMSGIQKAIINPAKEKLNEQITPPGQVGTPLPEEEGEAREYIRRASGSLGLDPTQSEIMADQMLRGQSQTIPGGAGDQDIIDMIKQNPNDWAVYQAASPVEQAKYREIYRQAIQRANGSNQ